MNHSPGIIPTTISNMAPTTTGTFLTTHPTDPEELSSRSSGRRSSNKGQGSFPCETCGRSFLFKNNLKAHTRTHTRDKKYVCDLCTKSFIYKESLKNHMLLHSNELPYHCDICGKKFRDRSNRRKHVKNVHKCTFPSSRKGGAGSSSALKDPNSKSGRGRKSRGPPPSPAPLVTSTTTEEGNSSSNNQGSSSSSLLLEVSTAGCSSGGGGGGHYFIPLPEDPWTPNGSAYPGTNYGYGVESYGLPLPLYPEPYHSQEVEDGKVGAGLIPPNYYSSHQGAYQPPPYPPPHEASSAPCGYPIIHSSTTNTLTNQGEIYSNSGGASGSQVVQGEDPFIRDLSLYDYTNYQ